MNLEVLYTASSFRDDVQNNCINLYYSNVPLMLWKLQNFGNMSPESEIDIREALKFVDEKERQESGNLKKVIAELLPKLNDKNKNRKGEIWYFPRMERDFGIEINYDDLDVRFQPYIDSIINIRDSLREQYEYYQLYCYDLVLGMHYLKSQILKLELTAKSSNSSIAYAALTTVCNEYLLAFMDMNRELRKYYPCLINYNYNFEDYGYDYPDMRKLMIRYYNARDTDIFGRLCDY